MIKKVLVGFFLALALPVAAQAATLSFGGANSVKTGNVFNVSVLLSTQSSESANAVSATVSYPSDLLRLVSISKGGSIITLWPTDPTVGSGSAEFGGIILNPGWSGTKGTVVIMTFEAQAAGSAKLSFGGDASVLANDGNGTPILAGAYPATITIGEGTAPTAPIKTPTKTTVKTPAPAKTPTKVATTTATSTPVAATTVPTTKPIVPVNNASGVALFMQSMLFINILELLLVLLVIFLAWHRYNRGVPPFYFTFEGKAPMTPPTPEVLLKQFDELKEAIKLEAVALQSAKAGQPMSESEQRFIMLFEKLIKEIESPN